MYYGLASPLLLAPPKFSWLVFCGSIVFLIGTSFCVKVVIIMPGQGGQFWSMVP